ncbi:hypothetical protein Msi02_78920 [Microbispora siamensis]|uniref:Uncharacterized protein n=1 Tax=Microbispora siamensis TaxID=564413 RepID=A0ABQ4H0C1_9ACTN|nr:hypothetical protein Msi02_78920 [Microbispora siamensis]
MAAVPFAVNPKVVEPPTATEPLQEKRTRGVTRAIDAALRDRGTHTTRASRTAVLTAHHHMAGGGRLWDRVWETTPKCVKTRKKVSEPSRRRPSITPGEPHARPPPLRGARRDP